MNLTFHKTMDPHSLDVRREGTNLLGVILFHPGKEPRWRLASKGECLTFGELQQIVSEMERQMEGLRNG